MFSDSALISLIQQRDQGALNHLYEKYAGALHGLIIQMAPHGPHGMILESSFTSIVQRITEYDPARSRLFTWLLQVTRNTALKFQHTPTSLKDPAKVPNVDFDTKGMGKFINSLSPDDREIVRLSFLNGYSSEEISRIIGLPADTVRQKLRLALSRFKH